MKNQGISSMLKMVSYLYLLLLTTASATDVALVRSQTYPELRIVDAVIEAVDQATVSAQTQGRIVEITVDVDDYVAKNTIIMRLRDVEQRAAYNAAKAQYDEANADYSRTQEIYTKKLIAKSVLDKAEARRKAAQAKLDQAREALEHTRVRAPYSGIVVKRHVEVGENARVGQKLMTGLSLEKLRARVELPQSMIYKVRKFQKAWVLSPDNAENRIEASSLTISPFADPLSHTFSVRVNLPTGDHHIYPGMYTKVAFLIGEAKHMVIPATAVIHRSEVTAVYVEGENKQLQFRQIRPGRRFDTDNIEVLAGLSEGEKVYLYPAKAAALIQQRNSH